MGQEGGRGGYRKGSGRLGREGRKGRNTRKGRGVVRGERREEMLWPEGE